MSANFGENRGTQGNYADVHGDLSMIEGLTKADLFVENNQLQKALKFMEAQLEEKMSKLVGLTARPGPGDRGRQDPAPP